MTSCQFHEGNIGSVAPCTQRHLLKIRAAIATKNAAEKFKGKIGLGKFGRLTDTIEVRNPAHPDEDSKEAVGDHELGRETVVHRLSPTPPVENDMEAFSPKAMRGYAPTDPLMEADMESVVGGTEVIDMLRTLLRQN